MGAARSGGAVELIWDRDGGFIQRVNLASVERLAAFLGKVPLSNKIEAAHALFSLFIERFPVLQDILQRWGLLHKVRGLGPESAADWIDAIRTIEFARLNVDAEVALPIREASARIFNDSKRIEKLSAQVDVLLANSVDAEIRQVADVWYELGLFREEHPVRVAGKVIIERERVTALLDAPYCAFPASSILRVAGTPDSLMTIENQTTFHSEARRRCGDNVLLVYTAGMPSPAWRAMYARILKNLPPSVSVYHWSDIDEGGFRIAAALAQEANKAGRTLLPWKMHPDDVPTERRRKASAYTLSKIMHFAEIAGWHDLGAAVAAAGFTVEQEGLS